MSHNSQYSGEDRNANMWHTLSIVARESHLALLNTKSIGPKISLEHRLQVLAEIWQLV